MGAGVAHLQGCCWPTWQVMPVPFSWGELSGVSIAGQSNIWPLNSFIYRHLFSSFHHFLKEAGELKYLIHFFFLLQIPLHKVGASLVAQLVKNPTAMQETLIRFLGWEDPLEKGKATCLSAVFWPGESHGLYSPWGHKELDSTEQLSLSLVKQIGPRRYFGNDYMGNWTTSSQFK